MRGMPLGQPLGWRVARRPLSGQRAESDNGENKPYLHSFGS